MNLTVKYVTEHSAVPRNGAYCLVKGNGEVFLVPTTYGRNETVFKHLSELADRFNSVEAAIAYKRLVDRGEA